MAEPVKVTLWVEDLRTISPEMFARVVERELAVNVTDWTVEHGIDSPTAGLG
jgi:hypothetical protein